MLNFEILEGRVSTPKVEEKLEEKYTKRREENIAMKVNSTNSKNFQLIKNEKLLGELSYKNILFLKANIKLSNDDNYEIKPVGFWGTKICVTKNGAEIAVLKMNWNGNISIAFHDGEEFVVKAKGWFDNTFFMEDKAEKKIMQLEAKFSWRKFYYSYDISYEEKSQDALLILLGVYAANYYLSNMSGGM